MNTTFSHTENTRIYKDYSGNWTGETHVKVNGKCWVITTMKRYSGKIATHCHVVEDQGGGSFSYMMFSNDKTEEFWLNELPNGTKATEKTVKEAHYKALAEFDAKNEVGELPDAKKEYQIEVGQIIFTDFIQGSNNSARRAIYEIENTKWGIKYKTVLLDGSATAYDDHIRPYSKKFGIGVYYNEGEKISQDEINDLLIRAHENMQLEAAKNEAQAIINENQAKAKAEYLSQFSRADRRTTTNIIKRHILKTWPAVSKVEVKTDVFSGGDSMDVTYYSPEKIEALESFIKSFKEGHFDGMTDMYEYDDKSEIILDGHILQTYKYSSVYFEQSAEIREQKTEPEKIEAIEAGNDFELVQYSEKAIAVFGNTKPIKDQLKEIGGRFNAYLTHKGQKMAGWIFSKSKEQQLKALLNIQ
jgi:hypothetical protein